MKRELQNRRKRIFDIIQIGNVSDFPSRAFDLFLVAVILLNITVLILQTFDGMQRFEDILDGLEGITVAVFIVEYILRIRTADFLYPQKTRGSAIISFVLSFDGMIELLTILPFFFLSGFRKIYTPEAVEGFLV